VSKLSLAIAAITVLPAVAMFGFDPNSTPSVQGLNALSVAYALVPCLLKLAALAMVWHIKRSKSVA
jgi:GPH family glycoside/pentoside/hexuronide:cation symporter